MKCSNYEDQSATAFSIKCNVFSICIRFQLGNLFSNNKMSRVPQSICGLSIIRGASMFEGGGRGLLKRDWEVGDSDQRRQVFFVLMEGFPIK